MSKMSPIVVALHVFTNCFDWGAGKEKRGIFGTNIWQSPCACLTVICAMSVGDAKSDRQCTLHACDPHMLKKKGSSKWALLKHVTRTNSIGTCSSELYIFSLLKLPPPPRAAICYRSRNQSLLKDFRYCFWNGKDERIHHPFWDKANLGKRQWENLEFSHPHSGHQSVQT